MKEHWVHTPTTGEVREVWAQFSEYGGLVARSSGSGDNIENRYSEFDRWLAAHDAEVAAKTWTEAIYHAESAGLSKEARRSCMADNPYEDQP